MSKYQYRFVTHEVNLHAKKELIYVDGECYSEQNLTGLCGLFYNSSFLLDYLNKIGDEGWELLTENLHGSSREFIFKKTEQINDQLDIIVNLLEKDVNTLEDIKRILEENPETPRAERFPVIFSLGELKPGKPVTVDFLKCDYEICYINLLEEHQNDNNPSIEIKRCVDNGTQHTVPYVIQYDQVSTEPNKKLNYPIKIKAGNGFQVESRYHIDNFKFAAFIQDIDILLIQGKLSEVDCTPFIE
jgi:hypothetical protein